MVLLLCPDAGFFCSTGTNAAGSRGRFGMFSTLLARGPPANEVTESLSKDTI